MVGRVDFIIFFQHAVNKVLFVRRLGLNRIFFFGGGGGGGNRD